MIELAASEWLASANKGPDADGTYRSGQSVCLTAHMVRHVTGQYVRHLCIPSDMDSFANTGSAYVILDQSDVDSLNKYGQL